MRTPEEIKNGLEHCRTGVPCAGCPYLEDEIIHCWDNLMHDLVTYIQQLEAQQPHWISVGERLPPEDDNRVICYCDATGVFTHWMPLLAPPKAENADK